MYLFSQFRSHEPQLNARCCTRTQECSGEANGPGTTLMGPTDILGLKQLLLASRPSSGETLALCLHRLLDALGPMGRGTAHKHQQVPMSSG